MSALVPMRASGILLKLNGRLRMAYAETFGLTLEVQRMLSVTSVCSRSSSHNCMGKFGSTVASPLVKWSFPDRMALSAALCL